MNVLTHNGKITVKSPTGEHRVFRVKTQPKSSNFAPGERVLYVKENNKWVGFAFVHSRQGDHVGRINVWNRLASLNPATTPFKEKTKYEKYVHCLLHEDKYSKRGYEYMKEGKCRVCNRPLTDPQSIEEGIGPVCKANLGL